MKTFPLNIKIIGTEAFDSAFTNLGVRLTQIGEKTRAVGLGLTAGITTPLLGFGATALKAATTIEDMKLKLEAAGDSAEQANKEFYDLKAFSDTTPFAIGKVVDSFIDLKNSGLDPSIESMKGYANIAAKTNQSIESVIDGSIKASKGQFVKLKNFGFGVQKQGDNIEFSFKGIKTVVRNDAQSIEGYLQQMGRVEFAGAFEKKAQGFSNSVTKLQTAVAHAFGSIGEDIEGNTDLTKSVQSLTGKVNGLAGAWRKMPPSVREFAVETGIVFAVAGPLITGIGQAVIGLGLFVAFLPKIVAGFGLILAAAPFVLITATAATLGVMFGKLINTVGSLGDAFKLWGASIIDLVLWPLQQIDKIIYRIAGSKITSKFAQFSLGDKVANDIVNKQSPTEQARKIFQENREIADLQARALSGEEQAIKVLFENAPKGTRISVEKDPNNQITVEQGLSMQGGG